MRILRNFDVSSYYPSLMVRNEYTSRNIPDPEVFKDVYNRRIAAKKAGDKATANSLKLILNTTYGATLNRYNELYDPLMARSVCISGQLYLLELANRLLSEVNDLRIVQLNTDGIMLEFDEADHDEVLAWVHDWENRTGFRMEEDEIAAITQKDVNNYVEVAADGSVKKKGAYVVRGIAPAGAFNINNNAVIVADAITEYFVHGTAPEDTIRGCKDISKFMLIAKAGSKYSGAYQLVGGNRVNTQKVNRVYASPDETLGTLYKVKADTGAVAKIEGLPEHCVIDNSAVTDPHHLKVDQIDLQWYINLAHSRIDDFLGATRKKGRTMAEKTTATPKMNLYQKLNVARLKFLEANVQKSGKHPKLMYKFFELDDIVPVAEKAFAEVGLLARPSISENIALITVIDVDKPDDMITFEMPFTPIQPIISNSGQTVTNEMQALGASITYVRRYLWMLALDICESDEIDNGRLPTPQEVPAPAKSREETVKTLTDPAAQADELQLRQLAELTDQLKASSQDPKALQLCKIAEDTTRGFTTASRENAALLLGKLNEYLNGGKA